LLADEFRFRKEAFTRMYAGKLGRLLRIQRPESTDSGDGGGQ
jgi:hypothetical protein